MENKTNNVNANVNETKNIFIQNPNETNVKENVQKKLIVNNLKISFRTNNGKVQAVRDISFELNKGETLAIVGESGSGKSVTSRAILGILAPNAIIEGGEILYDGKDLLKIDEDDFHSIRGDKIAMIFQDPMSSLNPIMKVGKQLTEAMLLKGKANQKEAREIFNSKLKLIEENMNQAEGNDPDTNAKNKELCQSFNKFEIKHIQLELKFNEAHLSCEEAIDKIESICFDIENKIAKNVQVRIKEIVKRSLESVNEYVVTDDRLKKLLDETSSISKGVKEKEDHIKLLPILSDIRNILKDALNKVLPNFFAYGYYLTYVNPELPKLDVVALNEETLKILNQNMMSGFVKKLSLAIENAHVNSTKKQAELLPELRKAIEFFSGEFSKEESLKLAKELREKVIDSINLVAINKDNISYTFGLSFADSVDFYFNGIAKNNKEEIRYSKDKAKWDKIKEKGKTPGWKVVPKNHIDIDLARENIIEIIQKLLSHYENLVNSNVSFDYENLAVEMIDYLKDKASGVVYKVTNGMAHRKALKLLEEVGISEPRKRYNQYPFEFSGGMRQRIVIAIALAANPDILICDEPTTALDVTIQSQILELINKLKIERKLAVIFITHDLGVVANMADRIAVMYAGKLVEYGTDYDIFYDPRHPYTWALLSSMPDLDTKEKLEAIPGTPPNMIYPPKGDAFAARNKYAMQIDFEQEPPLFKISDDHYAATWLLHENAPKLSPPAIILDRIKRNKEKEARSNE